MTGRQEHVYKGLTTRLIIFTALFHALLAAILRLGNDESYYWLYSRDLKWNYFDHPPMVAFFIRAFSLNGLLGDAPLVLRLGSVFSNAAATFFLFKALHTAHSARAGWFAALLFQGSFYAGLTAGIYVMPDAPQMLWWTLSLWMLAGIIRQPRSWKYWLLFGAAAGLCIMSKVHGGFLWIGVGAYIVFCKRNWLRQPQVYAAAAITLLMISPIIVWNIEHDFVAYRFHSGRVAIAHFGVEGGSFLRELTGQLVFNNPVNVFLIIAALVAFVKKRIRNSFISATLFIALPHAVFLLVISLFRNTTLPHWSGPAYVTLICVASAWIASRPRSVYLSGLLKTSLALYMITILSWAYLVDSYPGSWGSKSEKHFGKGDISLDFYGWREASEAFRKIYAAETANGTMPAQSPVVFSYWWGAHIEYYFCRKDSIPAFGLGGILQLREYSWRNDARRNQVAFTNAYCIMPEDEQYLVPSSYFKKTMKAQLITVHRRGKPAHRFRIYRLQGWNGILPGYNGPAPMKEEPQPDLGTHPLQRTDQP